jgi:photosystem II stability/assembly factor-like uncharacterized protein
MKRNLNKKIVAVFILFVLCYSASLAQWVSNGPFGGPVFTLGANNAGIYAGTNLGIFMSANNGSTWKNVNGMLPAKTFVRSFLANGNSLFAGTDTGAIYLSTDNGLTWSSANIGIPLNSYITSLAGSSSAIFAGVYGKGVYTSLNNGTSWTTTSTLPDLTVRSLAVSGSTVYAGTESGVYFSTNNGNTWTAANTGITN